MSLCACSSSVCTGILIQHVFLGYLMALLFQGFFFFFFWFANRFVLTAEGWITSVGA